MAIELRQQLKLTQQLIMTPQLQMAIKLLQLSRLELMDAIRQEMEENPTLEESQETLPKEQVEVDPQDQVPSPKKPRKSPLMRKFQGISTGATTSMNITHREGSDMKPRTAKRRSTKLLSHTRNP
jgi:DNA-directed RNA polymerase specialized sigma54-like protein